MHAWQEKSRESAERKFRGLASPTSHDEPYRFSAMMDWENAGKGVEKLSPVPEALLEEAALLALNGETSRLLGAADGVVFSDLAHSSDSTYTEAAFPEDKFAQLAAARWQNGAMLSIPAGKKLTQPLRILAHATGKESFWRHLITLGENAEATVILECSGDDSSRFLSELVEIRLARGAKLKWSLLQRNGSGTQAFHRHKLQLERDSELKLCSVQLGGAKSQLRFEAILGEGSNLDAEGACRGDGAQHFDFWADVIHAGAKSKSRVEFSYVMAEQARSVFNGLIQVKHGANDCEATQKARSLLLGNGAAVHAIPKLIIQTDAVKCGHGASVSSVNPEQLHYLQSRGISRQEAERMIVRGFTEPVLVNLATPALYERADSLLAIKMGEKL